MSFVVYLGWKSHRASCMLSSEQGIKYIRYPSPTLVLSHTCQPALPAAGQHCPLVDAALAAEWRTTEGLRETRPLCSPGGHTQRPPPRELTLSGLSAPVKGTVVGLGQPAGWGSWCSSYGQNGVGGLYRVWGLPFLPPPAHSEFCPLPLNSPPTHLHPQVGSSSPRTLTPTSEAGATERLPAAKAVGSTLSLSLPPPLLSFSASSCLCSLPSSIKTMTVLF